MSTLRHAPAGWVPDQTRVRYLRDNAGLLGAIGTYVGVMFPVRHYDQTGQMYADGVLVQFDERPSAWPDVDVWLDVDVADLEVVTA